MDTINLGKISIPLIKPIKGVDYYTPTDKQEVVTEVLGNVNSVVAPQEQARQNAEALRASAETQRQSNETTRQTQEGVRQTNETNRQTAETARANAESTRQSNETSRNSTFNTKMNAVDSAIVNIQDMTSAYNTNATNKTNDFNDNASSKTTTFNNNATQKTTDFNDNATSKTNTFNTNASDKKDAFDINATSKTGDFNDNATSKTNTFNSNSDDKTSAFNQNATEKTNTFNENYTEKLNAFNQAAASIQADITNIKEVLGIDVETYSSSQTYNVGDLVVHSNKIYECNTQIAVAEEWDSTKWTEVDILSLIQELQAKEQEQEQFLAEFNAQYNAMLRSRKYTVGSGESVTLNNTAEGVEVRKLGISGNSKQTQLTGKNKLNAYAIDNSNVSVSNNGATITLPKSSTIATNTKLSDLAPSLEIGQTVKLLMTSSSPSFNYIFLVGSNTTWIGGNAITITQEILDSKVNMYGSDSSNVVISNMMILLNTETDTTFEKYVGGTPAPNPFYPQDINSSGDSGSINTTVGDRNVAKRNTGQYNNYRILQPIPVKAGDTITYIVNFTSTQSGDMLPRLYANKTMSQLLNEWTSIAQNGDRVGTITITADGYFTLAFGYGYTTVTFSKLFVAFGTHTLADYAPHAEQSFTLPCQQPMRGIGTTRDNFFKNVVGSEYYNAELTENAWYERHAVYRKIFDGTEDWNNTFGTNLFDAQNINQSIFTVNTLPSLSNKLSNYFKYNPVQSGINADTVHGEFVIQIPADGNIDWYKVFFKDTDFSTAGDFARWLATQYANETPVYADYILATPTYLQCTTAQVEVLEAIAKAKSYYEQTTVGSTDPVPPIYEVEAYQDENLVIDEINQAIVALGGV